MGYNTQYKDNIGRLTESSFTAFFNVLWHAPGGSAEIEFRS